MTTRTVRRAGGAELVGEHDARLHPLAQRLLDHRGLGHVPAARAPWSTHVTVSRDDSPCHVPASTSCQGRRQTSAPSAPTRARWCVVATTCDSGRLVAGPGEHPLARVERHGRATSRRAAPVAPPLEESHQPIPALIVASSRWSTCSWIPSSRVRSGDGSRSVVEPAHLAHRSRRSGGSGRSCAPGRRAPRRSAPSAGRSSWSIRVGSVPTASSLTSPATGRGRGLGDGRRSRRGRCAELVAGAGDADAVEDRPVRRRREGVGGQQVDRLRPQHLAGTGAAPGAAVARPTRRGRDGSGLGTTPPSTSSGSAARGDSPGRCRSRSLRSSSRRRRR